MQKGAIWKPTWEKKETSEKCWNFFKSCFNATRAHLKSPGEKKAKIGEWKRGTASPFRPRKEPELKKKPNIPRKFWNFYKSHFNATRAHLKAVNKKTEPVLGSA